MALDKITIEKLAALAKLELTEKEKESLQTELGSIFAFVDQLNEVNTADVPPTRQVTGIHNIARADEPGYDFEKEDMLVTMPETDEAGYLKVHAVFTDDSPSH